MRPKKKNLSSKKRYKLIKRASIIALLGNGILAILKISSGLFTGTLSVLGDGIDSSTDLAIAAMSLFVARISTKPPDRHHPFGHARAETIATTVLSFIIFFAGAQLILQAIYRLIRQDSFASVSLLAFIVTGISILGKTLLAGNQYRLGKKAKSPMLIANAKNMRSDILISASVLLGLFFRKICNLPLLDSLVAILVGAWIVKTAFEIFMEANLELMDGSNDLSLYQTVFDAVRAVPGAQNPHRTRLRCIGGAWDIGLDIEVDPEITVQEAHDISIAVEKEIYARIESVFDIVVHIEPAGCVVHNKSEQWGLKESEIRKSKKSKIVPN